MTSSFLWIHREEVFSEVRLLDYILTKYHHEALIIVRVVSQGDLFQHDLNYLDFLIVLEYI